MCDTLDPKQRFSRTNALISLVISITFTHAGHGFLRFSNFMSTPWARIIRKFCHTPYQVLWLNLSTSKRRQPTPNHLVHMSMSWRLTRQKHVVNVMQQGMLVAPMYSIVNAGTIKIDISTEHKTSG